MSVSVDWWEAGKTAAAHPRSAGEGRPGRLRRLLDNSFYHAFVHGRLPYDNINPVLKHILKNLRIRKLIFTNGDKVHAVRALKRLGLEDCFEGIICFETLNPPCPPQGDEEPEIFDIAGHFARSGSADELPKTRVAPCWPSESEIPKLNAEKMAPQARGGRRQRRGSARAMSPAPNICKKPPHLD
ncbi:unnamed protein product [Urochloa humidicola]